LRPQSDFSKAQIASELSEKIWPLFSNGRLKPIIDSVFDLEDITSAHLLMESSKHIGKILLKVEK
jgi:NADPH2:quinone reductase